MPRFAPVISAVCPVKILFSIVGVCINDSEVFVWLSRHSVVGNANEFYFSFRAQVTELIDVEGM